MCKRECVDVLQNEGQDSDAQTMTEMNVENREADERRVLARSAELDS